MREGVGEIRNLLSAETEIVLLLLDYDNVMLILYVKE